MTFFMIVLYVIAFLAVYVQVFFLVTFLENRKSINIRREDITLDNYPTVSVIVPCYNEENTVNLTVESLLSMNYPKDKLQIIVVDDGSKDGTWNQILKYENHPQIKIIHKENGGKHTALNLGLENAKSEFVGCLDADSTVHPETLKRIITFFSNSKTMAVAPSIVIRDPKTLLQYAQRAEYDMAHYNKKMLAFLDGIHVTPGPFSIFRREVFDIIGPYRKAHHTEDQEIALRMHKHNMKIDHCPDGYVYTGSPSTVPKLYRQRVRWMYGFIKNAIDYRSLFFRTRYGTIGMFTLPSGFISISGTVLLLSFTSINLYKYISNKILQVRTVGFNSGGFDVFSVDLFFVSTQMMIFISIFLYMLVIAALVNGRMMIVDRRVLSWDILLFIIVYTVIAPFWLIRAVFNAITHKEASWTGERDVLIDNPNL
jgi:cellulose synthase/poly-beta-1,6-N-acetylglucosamine synthase-like glycosyltransferase